MNFGSKFGSSIVWGLGLGYHLSIPLSCSPENFKKIWDGQLYCSPWAIRGHNLREIFGAVGAALKRLRSSLTLRTNPLPHCQS